MPEKKLDEKKYEGSADYLKAMLFLDERLNSIKDVICGASFSVRPFITDENGILDEKKLTALSKELAEYVDIYYSKKEVFTDYSYFDRMDSFSLKEKKDRKKILPKKVKKAYEDFFYCGLTALYDNRDFSYWKIDQFAKRKIVDKSILLAVCNIIPDNFSQLIKMAFSFPGDFCGYTTFEFGADTGFIGRLEDLYSFNREEKSGCPRPLDKEDSENYLRDERDFYDSLPDLDYFPMLDPNTGEEIEPELSPEEKLIAEYEKYLNDENYQKLIEFVEPYINGLDSADINSLIQEINGTWEFYTDFFADFHFEGLDQKYSNEELKNYLTSIQNLLEERKKEYYELYKKYNWNKSPFKNVTWSLSKYKQLRKTTVEDCKKQIHLMISQRRTKLPNFKSFEKHFHDFLYAAHCIPDNHTMEEYVRHAIDLFLYNQEEVKGISALKDEDTFDYYLAMLDVFENKIEQKRKRGDVS